MPVVIAVAVLLVVGSGHARAVSPKAETQSDAAALLASARQAMGEATLKEISSLEVFGSIVQTAKAGTLMNIEGQPVESAVGGRLNLSLNVKLVLPDKFLRTTKYVPPGYSSAAEVGEYRGFNGSDLVRDTNAPAGGLNDSKLAPNPKLPETRLQYLLDAKHSFAAFILPLMAASFDGYPFEFSVGSQQQLPSGPATSVVVSGRDGLKWQLFLDDTSHLPVMLAGRMKPIVSGLFVEYGILPDDWHMTITDYRVTNGIKWPRKFTSAIGDKILEETKYDRFSINQKIDLKVFKPSDGR